VTRGASRLLVLLLVAAAIAGAWEQSAVSAAARPRKVVIVSFAGLTWEDVGAGYTPVVRDLAGRGSVAAMSVRTTSSRTDLASALASIGAGNRVRGAGTEEAPVASTTVPVEGGGLRVEGMDDVRADNERLLFEAVPGTLGASLHAAGLRTGVVGNADGGYLPAGATARRGEGMVRRRYAGLALADAEGRIDAGDVDGGLVRSDPTTLNGWSAHPDAMVAAVRDTLGRADVVFVELADTWREAQIAYGRVDDLDVPAFDDDVPVRVAALARDDALLGRILSEVDLGQDTVLVVGTTGIGTTRRERLTAAVMAGVGAREGGWLTSATTRRDGIVALTDTGPGVLQLLGLPQPEAMTAQPFRSVPGPGPARFEQLARVQEVALFHSRWVPQFFITSLLLQAALYLFAYSRLPWGPGAVAQVGSLREEPVKSRAGAVRSLALAFMGLPLATLVVRAVGADLWGPAAAGLVLIGTCALAAGVGLVGPWRRWASGPPAFVCAVTGLVIVADLLTGSRLQMSSLLGYSPIVAGRFFGVGNLVFAVLGTSAMLVAAALAARVPRGRPLIVLSIGLVVVVAEGGPMFGADFGGVLAMVPAFGLLSVLVAGRRMSWRNVLLVGVATALGAALVGYVDSLRPLEDQTHIGRFFTRLVEAGPSAVSEIIVRKASANWNVLTSSVLTLSVPIAVAFVVLVLMRPAGRLRRALDEEPGLKWGLQAAAVVNLLGFALNDSGIAITAMGIALALPYCLATVLGMTDDRALPGRAAGGRVGSAR
jgi:hypothetical protein